MIEGIKKVNIQELEERTFMILDQLHAKGFKTECDQIAEHLKAVNDLIKAMTPAFQRQSTKQSWPRRRQ